MCDNLSLLDCTIRDGGQGLETAFNKGFSNLYFDNEDIIKSIDLLAKSGIDYIEVGYIEHNDTDRTRFASYLDIESVSNNVPKNKSLTQMFLALYTGPDTPLDAIPNWHPGLAEGIRVILRYSQLMKSLEFCEGLAAKGYKVFVQPMLTMRYSNEELELIIDKTNRMGAYALYIVDSYGYMTSNDVIRLCSFYEQRLDSKIKIGFHAHNNMNLAFANAKTFIECFNNTERKIIVDSCILGMGQGAGNLQTEIIVPYLNDNFGKKYDYNDVLDVCELVERLATPQQWGYAVSWLIPAIHKASYKYSMVMRHRGFSYKEMNQVFLKMPNELKQRYTEENLNTILNMVGITK